MQMPQASRRCPSCGELVPDTARHCPNCGTFVGVVSEDDTIPTVIDVTGGRDAAGNVRSAESDPFASPGDREQMRIDNGPFFRSYRFGDARDGGFRGNVMIARGGSRACLLVLIVSVVVFLLICLLVGWLFGQIL